MIPISPLAFSVALQLCILAKNGCSRSGAIRHCLHLPQACGPKKEKKEQISQSWKWYNIFVLLLSIQWSIAGFRSFHCEVMSFWHDVPLRPEVYPAGLRIGPGKIAMMLEERLRVDRHRFQDR